MMKNGSEKKLKTIFLSAVAGLSIATTAAAEIATHYPTEYAYPDYVYLKSFQNNGDVYRDCTDSSGSGDGMAATKMRKMIDDFSNNSGLAGALLLDYLRTKPVPVCMWENQITKNEETGYRGASFDWTDPMGKGRFFPMVELSAGTTDLSRIFDYAHETIHYAQIIKSGILPDTTYDPLQLLYFNGLMEASAYAYESMIRFEFLSRSGDQEQMLDGNDLRPQLKAFDQAADNAYINNIEYGKAVAWRNALEAYFKTNSWGEIVDEYSRSIKSKEKGLLYAKQGRKMIPDSAFEALYKPISGLLDDVVEIDPHDYAKYIPEKYISYLKSFRVKVLKSWDQELRKQQERKQQEREHATADGNLTYVH